MALSTGFDIEVTVKNKTDEFKFSIEDAKVNQILVGDKAISHDTLLANQAVIGSNIKVEGLSLNRISDSRLQLQSIKSVEVRLKATKESNWQVAHASIECIKAKVAS